MAGQPKKFKKQEFENFVYEYLNEIYHNQNDENVDIPTFYGFYQYVSQRHDCSYRTVRRSFDEYWTVIKKDFEDIRADLLIRGGSIGKYNTAMVIFALKNWCKWRDNPADDTDGAENKLEIHIVRE